MLFASRETVWNKRNLYIFSPFLLCFLDTDLDPAVAVKTQVSTGYSIPTVVGLNVVTRRIASPEIFQGSLHNGVLNVSPNSASKRPHSPIPELSPKRVKDTQVCLPL